MKDIRIEKEEIKPSIFADDMNAYVENSKIKKQPPRNQHQKENKQNNNDSTKSWQEADNLDPLYIAAGNVKWYNHLRKQFRSFLKC